MFCCLLSKYFGVGVPSLCVRFIPCKAARENTTAFRAILLGLPLSPQVYLSGISHSQPFVLSSAAGAG
jgi:hypothetical protein